MLNGSLLSPWSLKYEVAIFCFNCHLRKVVGNYQPSITKVKPLVKILCSLILIIGV